MPGDSRILPLFTRRVQPNVLPSPNNINLPTNAGAFTAGTPASPNNINLPFKSLPEFQGGSSPNPDTTGPFVDYSDSSLNSQSNQLLSSPFWGDSPRSWDVITMAGVKFPGIVRVSGRIAMRKDVKKVAGTNFAKMTHIGYEPAQIEITIRMWTKAHWDAFQALAQKIRPRANQPAPKAFDVAHPALAVYGIKSMEFIDAGFPQADGDASKGIYSVTIKALEYDKSQAGGINTNKGSTSGMVALKNAGAQRATEIQASRPSDNVGVAANFTPGPTQSLPPGALP